MGSAADAHRPAHTAPPPALKHTAADIVPFVQEHRPQIGKPSDNEVLDPESPSEMFEPMAGAGLLRKFGWFRQP